MRTLTLVPPPTTATCDHERPARTARFTWVCRLRPHGPEQKHVLVGRRG